MNDRGEPATTTAELVDDVDVLEAHTEAWDALAVAASRPWCAPAWLLAWWRHARMGEARLRTVLVRENGRLIGIAPCFVQLGPLGLAEYRFLGAGNFHRLEPLSEAGREIEVAAAIARALSAARPSPSSLVLEGFDARSPWPSRLQAEWPAVLRPRLRRDLVMPAPVLRLDRPVDEWLSSRSSNFRQQIARRRRRLERAGARARRSDSLPELDRDLDTLFRLHHTRWGRKGGSAALSLGVERALREGATAPGRPGRVRLWLLEVDGEAVAAQLFVAAGHEVAYWGGGLDPGWERDAPGVDLIVREIEAATLDGARRLDFGGGNQSYKWRFTGQDDPVAWRSLFPLGARYPLTRAQLAPKHVRNAARTLARRLPSPAQERLRRLARGRLRT